MPLTDDQAAELAFEINEAIPAAITFAKLPTTEKALVIKHFADNLVGTDETALIETIPGLTPEITEVITDALINVLAAQIAKLIDKQPEEIE